MGENMGNLEKTRVAAKEVGLTPWYLYKNSEKLPGAYRAGKALRWDINELKAWMRKKALAKRHI